MAKTTAEIHPVTHDCPICEHNGAVKVLRAPDRFHGRTQLYDLVRCPTCSLVWLDNPPPPSEIGNHYGEDYDNAIASAGETSPERWRKLAEPLLRCKSSGDLLDLGCSTGSFMESLKGQPWRLYGIEMSEGSARTAQARSGAQVFVGDILEAPFRPSTFDAITCFHVFEHLYQPRQVLEKVWEWLRPGGVFYVIIPNIDSAESRVFRSYWYPLELPRHLFHYSPISLRAITKSVGFQEVLLATYHVPFIEYNTRYIIDDILKKLGLSREPLAKANSGSLPWKVIRKVFRMSLWPVVNRLIATQGPGEIVHAVFMKQNR